jgi:hypothetical protein
MNRKWDNEKKVSRHTKLRKQVKKRKKTLTRPSDGQQFE